METPRERVLVVAGTATARRALRAAIGRLDLQVVEADGVEEAVRRCADRRLVLVVLAAGPWDIVSAVVRVRAATAVAVLLPGADAVPAEAVAAVIAADAPPGGLRRFGHLAVDVRARAVTIAGRQVHLTRKELDLLIVLSSRPGSVWTRDELLHAVWASPRWHDTATLSEHVHRLRRKIQEGPVAPSRIETVRGVGYRFVG